jgi:hypothetical protein
MNMKSIIPSIALIVMIVLYIIQSYQQQRTRELLDNAMVVAEEAQGLTIKAIEQRDWYKNELKKCQHP